MLRNIAEGLSNRQIAERMFLTDVGDRGLAGAVEPGAWCSLHWDWVCERLDRGQVVELRRRTLDQLAVVNGVGVAAAVG